MTSFPTKLHYLKPWLFFALCIATLVVCLLPGTPHSGIPHMDKLFHFGNYAVLGFLASISFPKHHYWWKLCLPLVVFGFLIECLQGLSGYRNFSWLDLLANTAGLITAGLVTKAKP